VGERTGSTGLDIDNTERYRFRARARQKAARYPLNIDGIHLTLSQLSSIAKPDADISATGPTLLSE
jgi:hypothetical protein